MNRLWLIFAQTVTISVAALFVVQTLKPEWLSWRQIAGNGQPQWLDELWTARQSRRRWIDAIQKSASRCMGVRAATSA